MRYETLVDELLAEGNGARVLSARYDIPHQKNTYARFNTYRATSVGLYLCDDLIAILCDDGLVVIVQGQNMTRTAQSRLNLVLGPLGFRIISRRNVLHVLRTVTGETMYLVPNHRLFTKGI